MIIDGKQKKGKRRLELLLTWIGWSYLLAATLQIAATLAMWIFNLSFGAGFLFNMDHFTQTVRVFLITIAIAMAVLFILSLWSDYNYNRYSRLTRRKPSGTTTNEELAAYFNIEVKQITEMQQSKYIEFDKTIV